MKRDRHINGFAEGGSVGNGFVEGHGFSRADSSQKYGALAPAGECCGFSKIFSHEEVGQ